MDRDFSNIPKTVKLQVKSFYKYLDKAQKDAKYLRNCESQLKYVKAKEPEVAVEMEAALAEFSSGNIATAAPPKATVKPTKTAAPAKAPKPGSTGDKLVDMHLKAFRKAIEKMLGSPKYASKYYGEAQKKLQAIEKRNPDLVDMTALQNELDEKLREAGNKEQGQDIAHREKYVKRWFGDLQKSQDEDGFARNYAEANKAIDKLAELDPKKAEEYKKEAESIKAEFDGKFGAENEEKKAYEECGQAFKVVASMIGDPNWLTPGHNPEKEKEHAEKLNARVQAAKDFAGNSNYIKIFEEHKNGQLPTVFEKRHLGFGVGFLQEGQKNMDYFLNNENEHFDTWLKNRETVITDNENSVDPGFSTPINSYFQMVNKAAKYEMLIALFPDDLNYQNRLKAIKDTIKATGGRKGAQQKVDEYGAEKLANFRMGRHRCDDPNILKLATDYFIKSKAAHIGDPIRVTLVFEAWRVERHVLTGLPLRRLMRCNVAAKNSKTNRHEMLRMDITQEYIGTEFNEFVSGSYFPSNGEGDEILEENIFKEP